jgi:AcrR family transcriptional regulator
VERLQPPPDADDVEAAGGERPSRRAPDAAAGARDDSDVAADRWLLVVYEPTVSLMREAGNKTGHARHAGRPPDRERRAATLARATDYVLTHGLSGLSLRPLARALGTSTRMLLYDFGTKEELIAEVLREARRREADLLAGMQAPEGITDAETLAGVWAWLIAPERQPFLRLFFEVYVDAINHPDAYAEGARPLVGDWLEFLRTRWRPHPLDPATATLIIAVVRGLLLDRMSAADPERVDRALERFLELIEP